MSDMTHVCVCDMTHVCVCDMTHAYFDIAHGQIVCVCVCVSRSWYVGVSLCVPL